MNDAYFTSDWHLDHERSLRFEARKGYVTHKELEEKIIDNAFEVLKPGDNLFYVGDLRWNSKKEDLDIFFNKFKSKRVNFHWVLGNHDKVPNGYIHSALKSVSMIKDMEVNKQAITLCHYPMLCWNKSHYNSWQLHGHIHYKDNTYNKWDKLNMNGDIPNGKRLNVNIELHSWQLWSYPEVEFAMSIKPDNWDYIDKTKILKDLLDKKVLETKAINTSTIKDYNQETQEYFNSGVNDGFKYMAVMCDTFSHEDYPSYHTTLESANEYINIERRDFMTRFLSLFDLSSGEKIRGV